MRNAGLDELQTGINIGWNQHNLRHADDTTLMAESKKELKSLFFYYYYFTLFKLKSLLMRVKEENERASLKLSTKKKTKIMASSPLFHGK